VRELPPLPDPRGVAGVFAGVSGNALLVAGGANFPGQPPWEGGQKKWNNEVYVLSVTGQYPLERGIFYIYWNLMHNFEY